MIDDDIPLPTGRPGRKPKWPFATLAVNQSFFAPVSPDSLRQGARRAALRLPGRAFVVRARVENDVSGARCWRTE